MPDCAFVKPLQDGSPRRHADRDDITKGAIMTDSTPNQESAPADDAGEVNALTPEQVHTTGDADDSGAAQGADEVPAEGQVQNPDQASAPAEADSPEQADPEEIPSNDELEEPSTEKDPGEEPKAPKREEPEPDHEAVGIGVVETEEPQAD
jgi:hypothetical protein